ncbi:MAG: efflux RND transporter periplasmic adaptor subunit [Bacteroidales bacterium]|nr:efflux RND transporter periplasmic adaptor subunit [Bacteroidales bacterium]
MDRIIEKKKWTTKKILTIFFISVFGFLIIYLLFFRDKSSRLYVDKNQLSISEVRFDKFMEFIPTDGVVYPKTTVYIDAVQGGVVENVFMEDGDNLYKGDTILKLLNTQMELNYMEQETRMLGEMNRLQTNRLNLEQNKYLRQKEIVQLNYEIDKVKRDFGRKKKLYAEEVIPEIEFEDVERDYQFTFKQLEISLKLQKIDSIATVEQIKDIKTSLKRMNDNLHLLRKNMENAYVKAPTDGVLSSFDVEIGETKSIGQHLGQIDKDDGYKLEANIDERYISRVYVGQTAEFDFAGKTYKLFINKIYTDVTNGSFQVDMLFKDEAPEHIKRGQTLQIKLIFSSAQDQIIIRRGGFFQETGGNWIYVVDPGEEFAIKRNIKINRQNTNYYEIMEGLQVGEKVIVSSYKTFGDKDKLIFKN